MKNIVTTLIAAVIVIGAASIYPSAAKSGEVESCLAMIEKMIGVEPSERVRKLCEEGKSKEAMQAAMMGD